MARSAAARNIARSCLAMRSRRLGRQLTRVYDEALRPLGLSTAQLNILVAIAVLEPVRSVELSDRLCLEKSTLSRNLARMHDAGWVRGIETDDARGFLLEMTASGSRVLEQAHPAWQQAQKEVRDRLGADAAEALDAMTEALRPG